MTNLEKKVVSEAASCIAKFDTYNISNGLKSILEDAKIDPKTTKEIIISFNGSMHDNHLKPLTEARSWLMALLERE